MKKVVKFAARKRAGAAMVEYALLLTLIGLACVVGIGSVGNDLKRMFGNVANVIANQNTNAR